MSCVAHSVPNEHPDWKPHLYSAHISEVLDYGMAQLEYLLSFSHFSIEEKLQIKKTMTAAMMLHDMGKLDERNQEVLRGEQAGRLPIDHIDAGVAVAASIENELMGWLIRGHHAPGLPSKKTEKYFMKQLNSEVGCRLSLNSLRGKRHKRTKEEARTKEDYENHFRTIERTDENLSAYKELQEKCCGIWPNVSMSLPQSGLTIRLLMSCLVDADHESAACYTNHIKMSSFEPAKTRWRERLVALEKYMAGLPKNLQNEREALREQFYTNCLERHLFSSKVVACSAPVGSGKTTSVLAYLLRKSIESNASRIIVIAPFTNIINQTVKTLRKAIVLNDEDPELAVAAYHHKLEFSSECMRQYSALWRAPVVVTTAVQFFETLANADPSRLRKLDSIVGASIFIDESHACLPVEFLKITWYWLKKLSDEWNCNIVFSSGSMVEFWNDPYMLGCEDKSNSPPLQVVSEPLPDLFPDELKKIAKQEEIHRVEFRKIEKPLSLDAIISLITSNDILNLLRKDERPCCLIILNTVQSCAVIADALSRALDDRSNKKVADKKVLHLSTALTPKDREKILAEIFRRQFHSEWENQPWYLIATSAVEAGVDLDFSIGFRERCSVTSFLQVSGRINRHGKRDRGILYDFSLVPDDRLTTHPGFKESSRVFDELWDELNSPDLSLTELSTKAQRKEFSTSKEEKEKRDFLCAEEAKLDFQEVSQAYRIINTDTATVIIDKQIVEKLELGVPVKWSDIQDNSVQLWSNKIKKWNLRPLKHCKNDEIYSWSDIYEYDPIFLGIMDGILKLDDFFENKGGIL
jgi:CRISPR-associated endonuclease/helicase Cas3